MSFLNNLPENWNIFNLDDERVSEIIMGQSPPSTSYNTSGLGLPFFQGKTDFGMLYPTVRKWCSAPIKTAKKNDILMSVRAPVGDVNICQEESCIGRGITAIRSKALCDYKYLFYHLISQKDKIDSYGTGAIFKSINKTILSKLKIVFPPPPEQKKIASILFKIQQAIELQDKIIEKTKELKKSTMEFLFTHGLRGEKIKQTEIGPIPESWEITKIKNYYTFTKKPKDLNYKKYKKIAFIPMELISNIGIFSERYIFKESSNISSGTYFEEGNLLLSKITPCFENEKQCIPLNIPSGFGMATTEVIPIKDFPNKSNIAYLFYYLLKPNVRNHIASKMEGATGRQRVPTKVIKELNIPFPPLPEQENITNIFLLIDQKIKKDELKKNILQNLFNSMLNKLMQGKINTNSIDIKSIVN